MTRVQFRVICVQIIINKLKSCWISYLITSKTVNCVFSQLVSLVTAIINHEISDSSKLCGSMNLGYLENIDLVCIHIVSTLHLLWSHQVSDQLNISSRCTVYIFILIHHTKR